MDRGAGTHAPALSGTLQILPKNIVYYPSESWRVVVTTYRLDSPPRTSGIYALKNIRTGHIYIGQTFNLLRRYSEWKGLLTNGVGRTSKDFMAIARETAPADWEFRIIAQAPIDKLAELEDRAIARIREASPDLCLNRDMKKDEVARKVAFDEGLSERKSTVMGPHGPMTYREIANHYGVTKETIKQKLLKLRKRGVFEMDIKKLAPKGG